MTQKTKAATDARLFLHQFRSLVVLAESVIELGDIEASAMEGRVVCEGLVKEREKEQVALDKVLLKVEAAQTTLAKLESAHDAQEAETAREVDKARKALEQELVATQELAHSTHQKTIQADKRAQAEHNLWVLTTEKEKKRLTEALASLKAEMSKLREKLA